MVSVGSLTAAEAAGAALLVVGRFEEDLAVVRRVRGWPQAPALLGAVAAGLPAFGEQLGGAAEDVLGPVQWWPSSRRPEVGPSGADFAGRYQRRTGSEPSYVAAQAAAAGYLGHAAHRQGLVAETVRRWRTSTLLGDFVLDAGWRQVGHRVRTIRWQHGRWSRSTTVRRAHRAWIRVWAMAEVTEEGTFDPAEFQDELAVAASNLEVGTRLWFQNDRIKVWEVNLAPGERGPFHAHTRRYFWTVVEPGTGRQRSPDGTLKVRRYEVGDTQYSEPSLVDPMIHDLENAGQTRLRFVTVELLD
jgi:hypothetical protein